MTPAEAVTREERIAIMVICGNCSESEAQLFCDKHPELYGICEVIEVQEQLLLIISFFLFKNLVDRLT